MSPRSTLSGSSATRFSSPTLTASRGCSSPTPRFPRELGCVFHMTTCSTAAVRLRERSHRPLGPSRVFVRKQLVVLRILGHYLPPGLLYARLPTSLPHRYELGPDSSEGRGARPCTVRIAEIGSLRALIREGEKLNNCLENRYDSQVGAPHTPPNACCGLVSFVARGWCSLARGPM